MTKQLDAVWRARRELVEGEARTLARLATAFRVSETALERRVKRDGWMLSGATGGLTRAERIARVHDRLLDRIERAQLDADRDEAAFDKAMISELSSAARMLGKIAEGMADEDALKEQQLERDADIAAILDKLDTKIVELARHLAEELARGGTDAQATGQAHT